MLRVKRLGKYVKINLYGHLFYARRKVINNGEGVFLSIDTLGETHLKFKEGSQEDFIYDLVNTALYKGFNEVTFLMHLAKVNIVDYKELNNDLKELAKLNYLLDTTIENYNLTYDFALENNPCQPKKIAQICYGKTKRQGMNLKRSRCLNETTIARYNGYSVISENYTKVELNPEVIKEELKQYFLGTTTYYALWRDQTNFIPIRINRQTSSAKLLEYTATTLQLYSELIRLYKDYPYNIISLLSFQVKVCLQFKCTPKLLVDTWGFNRNKWLGECLLTYVPVFKQKLKEISITDKESIEYIGRLSLLAKGAFDRGEKDKLSRLCNYDTVYEDIFSMLPSQYNSGAKYGLFQCNMDYSDAFYDAFKTFYTDLWNICDGKGNVDVVEAFKLFRIIQIKDYKLDYIDDFIDGKYSYTSFNDRDTYMKLASLNSDWNMQNYSSYGLVYNTGTAVLFSDNSYVIFSYTNKGDLILNNHENWTDKQLEEAVKVLRKHIRKPVRNAYKVCTYFDNEKLTLEGKIIGHGRSRYTIKHCVKKFGGTYDKTL